MNNINIIDELYLYVDVVYICSGCFMILERKGMGWD